MVSRLAAGIATLVVAFLLVGCGSEREGSPEAMGSVMQATQSGPADPPGSPSAGCGRFVTRLANGSVRYAITFLQPQSVVEVFVKKNGTQIIAQNIVSSAVLDGEGTYTYSLVRPASEYQAGNVLLARFYSVRPGKPGVYTPGPTQTTWAPSFTYGQTTCALEPPSGCHENINRLPNGDLRFSVTLPDTQQYVEAFVKKNGTQLIAQNIVSSRVTNGNGTSTFSLVRPASQFQAGDAVVARFYSYKAGQPGVFTPGPLEQIWLPELVVGAQCTACPTGLRGPSCNQRVLIPGDGPGKPNASALARTVPDYGAAPFQALSVGPQQQVMQATSEFKIRFTKIRLGSDGCGGEVEPALQNVIVNGISKGDRDLSDHDEDSEMDISEEFTASVDPFQGDVAVHVQILEEDDGFCVGSNVEYTLDMVIDNRSGFVALSASGGGTSSSLVEAARTCSPTLNGWGLCWEVVTTGPPPIENPTAPVSICAGFKAAFVDAGYGEDGLVMPTEGVAPAAFAFAELWLRDAKLFTGFLDVQGCIPAGQQPTRDQLMLSVAETSSGSPLRLDYKPQFCVGGPATVTQANDCDMAVTTVPSTMPPNQRTGAISWKVFEVAPSSLSARLDPVTGQRAPLQINVASKVFAVPTLSASPSYDPLVGQFSQLGVWLVPGASFMLTAERNDPITRAAAVSAHMLKVSDNGIVSDIYRVFANDACPTDDPAIIGDSCAVSGDLFMGPGLWTLETGDTRFEQTRWKYVFAHEAGHMVQEHVTGTLGFLGQYGYDANGNATRELPPVRQTFDPPNTDAQCRCDHVDTANKLHCLQSIERSGEAHTEGFAQFYASKMFNNLDGADCSFSYYKEMGLPTCTSTNPADCQSYTPGAPSELTQLVRNRPPVKRDCLNPAQWRDRHCSANATRTTEMDWMSFYVRINSAGPARLSMADIWTMYGRICGSPQTPYVRCTNRPSLAWSDLTLGAEAVFGPLDPRRQLVVTSGSSYGVDTDTAIAP